MRIGVTGGIGCGKSYVCHLLQTLSGMPLYDCDSEAKRLMQASASLRRQLQALVGEEVYDAGGHLDKAVMSRYLFADAEHAAKVNAIVHPAVKADFLAWAERQAADVLMESAILVEAGFRDVVDYLVVVDAPLELRIERAMQRDGASRQQVEARIRQQADPAILLQQADFIVVNDGRDLAPQLVDIPFMNFNNIQ